MILQSLALICAVICAVSAAKCPKPEEIAPCDCFEGAATASLHCIGSNVTDQTIKSLATHFTADVEFNTLEVYDTAIKALPENAFGSAKFIDIHISSNPSLEKIDPNAFKASDKVATVVDIQNNTKLTGNELFELIRNLDAATRVHLDHNNITEIPANAFTPKASSKGHIETLYLTYNQIKSIGQKAFYGQPHLRVASIKYNKVERLDDNALTISKREGLIRTVSIYLDHNSLTEKSFTNSSLANPEHDDISIHMENNQLVSLPKDIFESFIRSSSLSRLYLLNNKFNCNCSMKWVHDLAKSIEKRFNEVYCSNHAQLNIVSLKATDFGECSFEY